MGLITDLILGLGDLFQWTFKNVLEPIGYYANWILTFVGAALLIWWCIRLVGFGNDNEKEYQGW